MIPYCFCKLFLTDSTDVSLSRRHFLRGHFLDALKSEQVKQQGYQTIRAPWTKLADFFTQCTACSRCIDVCEMHILVKGGDGYPQVDFTSGRGECSFCKACVNVCKAEVFRSTNEEPWQHRVEIQPQCLTQQRIECRSCEDSCEQRAIRFKRQAGGIATPQLVLEACNGCGACLSICPNQAIKILHNE